MRPLSRPVLGSLVFFAALSVVHTWPLALRPATFSRIDNGDMLLNAWAMAWVGHQLPRNPLHLFDANIFWPEHRTLAYSEHLVLQGILGMPVRALGGSPVLAHNVVMLLGFAFTGWAFCLLLQRWTGSWSAGVVSGSLAAFNSHTLTRLAHVQAVHLEFIALALLALDRLLLDRRARDAVTLGLAVTLQGLASLYLLIFSGWAMLFAGLARMDAWLRPGALRLAALVVLSATVAGATTLPFVLPYYRVSREHGFVRSEADARHFAASWADYLATGSRVHFRTWSRQFFARSRSASFPGVVALALVTVTLVGGGWRDPRCRMALALVAGGVLMSVLPRVPAYAWLHEHAPMMQVIRATSRFGILVLLGVAVLAGYGVSRLAERWGMTRAWPAIAIGLVLLVNAEAFRAPLWYARFGGVPSVYATLREAPGAVVVELPLPRAREFFRNAPYMLNSTLHWRPMLNGYSGFLPRSYAASRNAVATFPDDTSLSALHSLGVSHVIVHRRAFRRTYGEARLTALGGHPAFTRIAADGDIEIYQFRQ